MTDQRPVATGQPAAQGAIPPAAPSRPGSLHAGEVRRLFDGKAASWPAKYAPGGPLAGRLTSLSALIRQHAARGGRVLDLGCGTGELARSLAAAGLRVAACDISGQMLRGAAARDPGRTVRWVQLDPRWRQLPFTAAAFDAITAASVLEYVDEPAAVLAECARLLRPGGCLVCTVPDPAHPVRWLEWPAGLAARLLPAGAALARWPLPGEYLTYLRVSRQRHPARWWRSAGQRAGLAAVPAPALRRAPLRHLMFRLPVLEEDQ